MRRVTHSAINGVVMLDIAFFSLTAESVQLEKKWIPKMTAMAQLVYGAAASKDTCIAERRFRPQSSRGFFVRISTQLNHLTVVLQAMGNGLCVWSHHPGPRGGPRQAFLLSELRDCSSGRRLLCQQGTRRLLKLRGVVVGSVRTVWSWC